MRELRQYAEPVLKITCLILAVFVVIDLAGIFIRWNPFRGVTLPEVPSLSGPAQTRHRSVGAGQILSQSRPSKEPTTRMLWREPIWHQL